MQVIPIVSLGLYQFQSDRHYIFSFYEQFQYHSAQEFLRTPSLVSKMSADKPLLKRVIIFPYFRQEHFSKILIKLLSIYQRAADMYS